MDEKDWEDRLCACARLRTSTEKEPADEPLADAVTRSVLLEVVAIAYTNSRNSSPISVQATSDIPARFGDPMLNTEQLGWVLYTEYLIPFEVASMLLLVAMIGAIVLAKKNL